jgi:hypothetical protein
MFHDFEEPTASHQLGVLPPEISRNKPFFGPRLDARLPLKVYPANPK